jgi:hypothetical protein
MDEKLRRAAALMVALVTVVAAATLATVGVTPVGAAETTAASDSIETAPQTQPGPPFGHLDNVIPRAGGVLVTGWVIDPDTTRPILISIQTELGWQGPHLANRSRPDVGSVHREYGDRHGFEVVVPLAPGPHMVCVWAEDVAGGTAIQLGCRNVSLGVPFGSVDRIVRVPDGIAISGWVIDSDAAQGPVPYWVNVSGAWYGPFDANGRRPDVGQIHAWAGDRHGFDRTVPLPAVGTVSVCVHVLDVGAGVPATPALGCKDLAISNTVAGWVDVAGAGAGDVKVSGWAFDPDANDAVGILVTVDDQVYGPFAADLFRPDVAAVWGVGDRHGFDVRVPLPADGYGVVCVYGNNLGPGAGPVLFGCYEVVPLPAGSGEGRRVVYHNLGQRLWLVGEDGYTVRTYAISGRYLDPAPGTLHRIYGKFRYADAGHDGITMEYFVAFNPTGLGYGFHTIPVWGDGTPLQSEAELGQFRSAGCVRQARRDAVFIWNWSQTGDLVVVV